MPPTGTQLTVAVQAKNLLGLQPGIDRKQNDNPFVVDGKNFLFNGIGPYSGWGRKLITKVNIFGLKDEHSDLVQSFRTDDDSGYLFTDDAIYGYNHAGMIFYPVYSFEDIDNVYGWNSCFVANKHYFCRKDVGVIEYNPSMGSWTKLIDPFVPTNPVAVANVRGRLVILGSAAYAWSALDDPTNLTPDITTGAGNQSLAILGGVALKLIPLSDAGLVFTSKGIIIFEFSGGSGIFRHRVLTTKFKAVNALCIDELDTGVAVFMTENGLFTCDGKLPTIYQPIFSEFLSTSLLKQLRSPVFGNYKIFVHNPTQQFHLHVSTGGGDLHYEKSYVLYRPIDKFGSFDDPFHAFVELPIKNDIETVYMYCVVGDDGFVYSLSGESYIEAPVFPDDAVFWQTDFDWPAVVNDGVYLFPSLLTVSAEKVWYFNGLQSGWYTIGDQIEVHS